MRKMRKMQKKKTLFFNVKMRKIKNGYAKKCEKIVNYTSGKILAENF